VGPRAGLDYGRKGKFLGPARNATPVIQYADQHYKESCILLDVVGIPENQKVLGTSLKTHCRISLLFVYSKWKQTPCYNTTRKNSSHVQIFFFSLLHSWH